MYRLIVESLLGLRREGDTLRLAPCIPADWPEYSLRYRYGETVYRIRVHQQTGATARRLTVDGVEQDDIRHRAAGRSSRASSRGVAAGNAGRLSLHAWS